MLSVHTCPLAAPGGKETGGMNVYVREVSRELGRMGIEVDVFTRSQNPAIERVVPLAPGARVVHLPAGPEAPMPREDVHRHLDEFVDALDAWRLADGGDYDLVHGHYWLSGVAGLRLRTRRRPGCPPQAMAPRRAPPRAPRLPVWGDGRRARAASGGRARPAPPPALQSDGAA